MLKKLRILLLPVSAPVEIIIYLIALSSAILGRFTDVIFEFVLALAEWVKFNTPDLDWYIEGWCERKNVGLKHDQENA